MALSSSSSSYPADITSAIEDTSINLDITSLNITTTKNAIDSYAANVIEKQQARISVPPHKIWSAGTIKYTSNNFWSPKINKVKKEKCRRQIVVGVEVRDLPKNHFLAGEQGLFALEKFAQFDIIGEYTGRVVDDNISGHYVACLEDKAHEESLGK